MGKTGNITWVKVKNRRGKTRLVPERWAYKKRPGPAQKYTSEGKKRRKLPRSPNSVVG